MAKKSRRSLIILRTKKAMKVKLKATFIIFKGLSATKNYVCERERQRETLEISLSGHQVHPFLCFFLENLFFMI